MNLIDSTDVPVVHDKRDQATASFSPKTPGLKKIPPYWYPYRTNAKGRWFNREILELVTTEFRDRSVEYYRYALESGVTTINGEIAKPGTIVRNGDVIQNVVHRHEPPVTSTPVKILVHDEDRGFLVINKPGSIPVHASGRYFKNSIVEILKDDFGFKKVCTVNRLDRLTSGLMIIALTSERARTLTDEFKAGTIQKEYIARVKGEFPSVQIRCEEPLLTVDRQMGLNIVHPDGKPAQTIFSRLHYDPKTRSSVVHCRPLTGRSHQIRVHLQFLGYPIANDPVYSDEKIWGKDIGKGGLPTAPSSHRDAPVPPPQFEGSQAEVQSKVWKKKSEWMAEAAVLQAAEDTTGAELKPLPRETGHDIGMGSPVPLSEEAVEVITRLRNQKDEDEDWSRWRDVIFRAKGALQPHVSSSIQAVTKTPFIAMRASHASLNSLADCKDNSATVLEDSMRAVTVSESSTYVENKVTNASIEVGPKEETPLDDRVGPQSEDALCCPECYLPLHPDPKPEKLYIFLHALRYTTSLGSFETEMPEWASPDWEWDRE